MRLLGVYGAAGCGRGVLPLLRASARRTQTRLVFIDDGCPGTQVNGQVVLDWDGFLADPAVSKSVCLAVADPGLRERLAARCEAAGLPLAEARASDVTEMDDVQIGAGAVLSPQVTLTSNIRIGIGFHANIQSIIEHDCRIGNFVTFAPGVRCNGHVHIGDRAYIGAGALLRQGRPGAPLRIGADAVVGIGAVVLHDVPAGVTVVGNPARVLEKPHD